MPVPELKSKQESGGVDGAAVAVAGSSIGSIEVRAIVRLRVR